MLAERGVTHTHNSLFYIFRFGRQFNLPESAETLARVAGLMLHARGGSFVSSAFTYSALDGFLACVQTGLPLYSIHTNLA